MFGLSVLETDITLEVLKRQAHVFFVGTFSVPSEVKKYLRSVERLAFGMMLWTCQM